MSISSGELILTGGHTILPLRVAVEGSSDNRTSTAPPLLPPVLPPPLPPLPPFPAVREENPKVLSRETNDSVKTKTRKGAVVFK